MRDKADRAARVDGLDPQRSFIVEAPAGSGKTELLIQRYLTLLGRVEEPEQVVAVTFTRKAAAEMRARVKEMLRAALGHAGPVQPHRAVTLRLAATVLERDTERQWGILSRPGRLRIDTVDALNAWLADRLPVLAGGVAGGAVVEDAEALYRRVAGRALETALTDSRLRPSARRLLELADNDLDALIRTVGVALGLRDQWLGLLAESDRAHLGRHFTACVEWIVRARLQSLTDTLGPQICDRIGSALRHAAAHSERYAAAGGDGRLLCEGPQPNLEGLLRAWQAAAGLLLTGSGQWRRRFTRTEGFLPRHDEQKQELADLSAALAAIPLADRKLAVVRRLPAPSVTDEHIEGAIAAREVLRQTVAELKVHFQRENVVDFLELALGAQQALGSVDAPSDLLLALDRRIEHLLVDEFQDTSHSQFRLLELLTAGWSEGDGRTLFLVGDPMQSIYRFRNADMTLFLRAKRDGLGAIRLNHLMLRSNFRSAPAIVDWVNDAFREVFPDADDPDSGVAGYSAFTATREGSGDDCVCLHRIASSDMQAQHRRVAQIADNELSAAERRSVAVLVQSRSHLAGLREALGREGIRTRAVELDTLAEQPIVQDLLALTRAMLHFDDRISWLALLRAPWCGLTWAEVHALCADEPDRSIWTLLNDPERGLRIDDPDSRERVRFLRGRLATGLELRGRYPLARWIECCWQLLDGPACLRDSHELEQVRRFLETLASASVDGDVDDPVALDLAFDIPFGAAPDPADANALDIMTIHRAKGLQFDTVILFGLERTVRPAESRVIYWQQTPRGLIYSPSSVRKDRLTEYLQRVDRELERAERARLLYVAVTRARNRLHLIGHLSGGRGKRAAAIPAGSLLSFIADRFEATAPLAPETPAGEADRTEWIIPAIDRLETATAVPLGPLASAASRPVPIRTVYDWARPAAAHIGTVVHRALQSAGSGTPPELRVRLALDGPGDERYRRELRLLGVPPAELSAAAARVRQALARVLNDATGAWILSAHEAAESEVEITVPLDGGLAHLRIDRTFIDGDGVRWIIDYKTGRHSGGNVATFLDAEVARYRDQLEAYASAMHEIEPRAIRVGLYFPMLGTLRDWMPAVCSEAGFAAPDSRTDPGSDRPA